MVKPYSIGYTKNLASLYGAMGQENKSLPLFIESLKNISYNIEKNFSFLTENEKIQFFQQLEYKFHIYQSFFARYVSKSPEVAVHAYNIELMNKGLILHTVKQMRKVIFNSDQKDMIKKYEDWISLKKKLAINYSKSISERAEDVSELEVMAEKLEAELTSFSNAFSELTMLKKNTWKDVKASLDINDIAVEIAYFPYTDYKGWTDSILYIAILLSHQYEYPLLIPLFEEKQLIDIVTKDAIKESSRVNNIYNNQNLYRLLWKPIEKYFSSNTKIYWCPSGLLNKININAIQNMDSIYVSDIYNISLISTTANIIKSSLEIGELKDICIFGGMDYEADEQDISKSMANVNKDVDYVSRVFYIQDSTRSGKWSYLPGTKREAENIYKISKEANISAKLFLGSDALEEQYKNLDGDKSPSILHIATHGFFFPGPKITKEKLEIMALHAENPFIIADNPMNRSGLLFSGSNKAWVGDSISLLREDGILTADEASHTYLKNTELVVLSACETGLGDIKGDEGVYGLQRAFKMAGAQYLMMSLWKVPDNTTQEFMTTFYKELLPHKRSIRDAYNTTQRKMRDKYRYEPYKWAGFVLIE